MMMAYASCVSARMGTLMRAIESGESENLARVGLNAAEQELATQLFYMLVMLTRNAALTLVTNSGSQEGFLAWGKLINHYEPTERTRQAGQLMQLLAWDFAGDVHERLESFDRAVALYQARTKEVLSDSMKIGIALRQLEEGPLKQHMLMNSARLTAWPNFK